MNLFTKNMTLKVRFQVFYWKEHAHKTTPTQFLYFWGAWPEPCITPACDIPQWSHMSQPSDHKFIKWLCTIQMKNNIKNTKMEYIAKRKKQKQKNMVLSLHFPLAVEHSATEYFRFCLYIFYLVFCGVCWFIKPYKQWTQLSRLGGVFICILHVQKQALIQLAWYIFI